MDLRPRCNRCGTRILDPNASVCSCCQANLDEVGIWTELHDWAKTRQKGRARFVFLHVAATGALCVGGILLWFAVRKKLDLAEVLFLGAAHLLSGLVIGWLVWTSNEKEYAAHRHLLEHPEETQAPD